MAEPLAYLITFRTYGTWLHGDDRGAVDDEHNDYGTPMLPPDPQRLARERTLLKHEPVVFDEAQRRVVDAAIRDRCVFRGWELLELAVRTNHVHAVVSNPGVAPDRILAQLKDRSTRCLRDAGMFPRDVEIWSHRGSRRYLWNAVDLNAAVAYVREGQDVPR